MLILPIVYGIDVPNFILDLSYLMLSGEDDLDVYELVQKLNSAIADNIRLTPRIFVSHQHRDLGIATALTTLLESAFAIGAEDIRCTSVPQYSLLPRSRTSEQLRSEILGAELVIGILGPDMLASNYILCELGAAWGRDVPTFPLLVRGAKPHQVPPPLNERLTLSLCEIENCVQLIEYIARKTSLRRLPMSDVTMRKAGELADVARNT
jgi:hypothetical protein